MQIIHMYIPIDKKIGRTKSEVSARLIRRTANTMKQFRKSRYKLR